MFFPFQDRFKHSLKLFIAIFMLLLLGACNNANQYQDLEKKIQELKTKKPLPIAPLPVFKEIGSYTYSANNLRSPFSPSLQQQKGDAPNMNRPKEPLESFPLDNLHFVGTLIQGKKNWALILASNGITYKVTVGNYMGQNFGRIVNIYQNKIELAEIIKGPASWIEKRTFLKLTQSE